MYLSADFVSTSGYEDLRGTVCIFYQIRRGKVNYGKRYLFLLLELDTHPERSIAILDLLLDLKYHGPESFLHHLWSQRRLQR